MLKYLLISALFMAYASTAFATKDANDPHRWLEDIDGDEVLSWVNDMNKATAKSLGTDPLYKVIYQEALSALDSQEKLPVVTQIGDWIYSLKKSPDHPRGVYRRTSLADFKSGKPVWKVVLDIDALSKKDNTKWVFQGMTCLKPKNEQCLVSLSPGGGDAIVIKEFNAATLKFVENGFQLPMAKMSVSWIDEDHLFLGTDFGEGSMTDSGYPRLSKIWQRGTPVAEAVTVFETDKESVITFANRFKSESGHIDVIFENLNYWNTHYYQLLNSKPVKLNLPATAALEGVIKDQLVVSLNEDWRFADETFKQGAVLLIEPSLLRTSSPKKRPTVLVQSTPDAIVEQVTLLKNSLLVTVLEDVKSKVYRYQFEQGAWRSEAVMLPGSGNISIQTTSDQNDEFIARYEGFLTPPTLYSVDSALAVSRVMQQAATFDSSKMKVEQYFTESNDGTRVPYFAVMKKDTLFNGKNPTHIFSYGGFRVSLVPSYSGSYEALNGVYGKAWLERGGVFVLANIRGGAEYGPAWHAASLRENRVKSFEDFEAVAEDLFKRNITSAKHLGIEGRSNGGLLVGATMIRRPDLYGAVICGMPLLDMQRYNKLLAGASWMAEYGNPDTQDWSFMKTYSPYQNVSKAQTYPPIFFFTSTRDDRVHPGHARKMAARMVKQGHRVAYYENTEGGHKGSATSEQTAERVALSFTHLWRYLQ